MPIDPDFPKNHQPTGKHQHSDGEHFHFVWGPGRAAEAAENEEVKSAASLIFASCSAVRLSDVASCVAPNVITGIPPLKLSIFSSDN